MCYIWYACSCVCCAYMTHITYMFPHKLFIWIFRRVKEDGLYVELIDKTTCQVCSNSWFLPQEHTNIHTQTYTCTQTTYTHRDLYPDLHKHIHTETHAHTCPHTDIFTHIERRNTCTHRERHPVIDTETHTETHVHTERQISRHTYTDTDRQRDTCTFTHCLAWKHIHKTYVPRKRHLSRQTHT